MSASDYTAEEALALLTRARKVARSLVREPHLVDDLASAIVVAVMEHRAHEPIPFVTLKHYGIDEIRRWRKRAPQALDDVEEPIGRVEGEVEAVEARVSAAMAEVRLTPLEGRFVYLTYYKGITHMPEVAAMLKISVEQVREISKSVVTKLRQAGDERGSD